MLYNLNWQNARESSDGPAVLREARQSRRGLFPVPLLPHCRCARRPHPAWQLPGSDRQQQQQISPYLTRHTLARAGLANRLLDRHEVVTIDGDVVTLRQATP